MKNAAKYGTAIVLAHLAVSIVHGIPHRVLHIELSSLQTLYVLIVIVVCPLIGMALLLTTRQRAGAWLLAVSMLGSLGFGAWNHFVAGGPDHVAEVGPGAMGSLFRVTAVLLALTEAAGVWLGINALRRPDNRTGKNARATR
jgi:hypothetical protein